jgi:hypothetical protein
MNPSETDRSGFTPDRRIFINITKPLTIFLAKKLEISEGTSRPVQYFCGA